MFTVFLPLFLQSSHPEKVACNHKQMTRDKGFICLTVSIPHGQVHRHPVPTPGTPRAPWPCSRPGRGWPPGGRRPGSVGGCPGTKHRFRETQVILTVKHTPATYCITLCCSSLITSCVLCKPSTSSDKITPQMALLRTVKMINKMTLKTKQIQS